MIRAHIAHVSLVALLALNAPAFAEGALPALFDVKGVAGNDVLNIRAAPNANAAIIGSFGPQDKNIEVVGTSADGKWARVNAGEAAGYAALRLLARQNAPDWNSLQGEVLRCFGTEPFWSAIPVEGGTKLVLSMPDMEEQLLPITQSWPADFPAAGAAYAVSAPDQQGFIALHGAECSDGMTDRAFGITADLYLSGSALGSAALHGCCSVAP